MAVGPSTVFIELRKTVGDINDRELGSKLAALVDRLEKTQGTPSYTPAYQEFLAVAANCMTIIVPFLPALAQLLPS
jgi:hypothetical protein